MLGVVFSHATLGRPPPERALERLVYGFAQPVVGLRCLFSDRGLLRRAMTPVSALAAFCACSALLGHDEPGSFGLAKSFYATFSLLAPLPSLLFGAHYARLAAEAHRRFGHACEAKVDRLPRSMKRALFQWVLVGSASFPLALLGRLEGLGPALAATLGALWALHWIVVEALDGAQVLEPGATLADTDRAALAEPDPWFVRSLAAASEKTPPGISGLLRVWSIFNDRFSRGWREELRLVEREKVLCLGFAAATGVLLATPVLNLFFRPVIVVAASHLLIHATVAPRASGPREAVPAARE